MIKKRFPLGFQWVTQEPFLFCVHHQDFYPKGTSELGLTPEVLKGRNLGEDFREKDGFRMYHGDVVPGFPVHPHRGFETVTIVRKGYVDHADSAGAIARYGEGDVQWLTAGAGIQHSEMFPLLKQDSENTVELFQIWLNLPAVSKMVKPDFTMLWNEKIPRISLDEGRAELTLIAGEFNGKKPLSPPKNSWASRHEAEVAIWLLKMKKGSTVELPTTSIAIGRTLYFFEGKQLTINSEDLNSKTGVEVESNKICILEALESDIEVLILQSKSIGEPIFQHGPFVMNTREEVVQTFEDYNKTQFGGWPWPRNDMVHGSKPERFAKFPDGHVEKP
jgi:quercetin 2,3-dioxygenase